MRYSERFRVEPGSRIKLASIDPSSKEKNETKESAQLETAAYTARLRELQYLVYAEDRRSVLVCLQALDAAGKDGTIRHVLGAMNPQGTRVHAFKVPSREEAAHDFLWRAHLHAPKRGEIVVFNRSHYEDVLVVRVHDLVPKEVWSKRYELINEFERNLVAGGTHVIKFFLHISPEEQLERFRQRLEDPARQWKISESDYTERALWPAYISAYEDVLARTSTKEAPWYVIPANHKWVRDLVVSRIMVETLQSLGMGLPKPGVNLDAIRAKYHEAKRHGTESPGAGGGPQKR
jgi:PPK2 family polyphosphate:nucleotide phosphotransferase